MNRVSPAEAHVKMKDEGYVYVDVRTEDEFAAGHPEGALNVPWSVSGPAGLESNADFVPLMEALFAKDAPIVLGCQMGERSARAVAALERAGFTRVLDQRAGWDGVRGTFGEILEPGWSRVGLPREDEMVPDRAYAALKRRVRG